MAPTLFASLEIYPWRQFDHISIDLSERLTVLTGANGAGKTTLLSILGYHFSWDSPFARAPRRGREFSYDRGGRIAKARYRGDVEQIGTLHYQNGRSTPLTAPSGDTPQFLLSFDDRQPVEGIFLDSHRSLTGYQAVRTIPASFHGAASLFDDFTKEVRNPIFGKVTRKSPRLVMKESLIAAAVFGQSTESTREDNEARDVWFGFQDVLSELLPPSLGFVSLIAEPPEIIVRTHGGEFPLDALSGGLTAIFELGWQIFLRSRGTESFTVCFDEPENHLHPSLQRSIMPGLMSAFPEVRFVVATHSPFVVTSSRTANVVVLEGDEYGSVFSRRLNSGELGVSAEQTLRNVLDVGSTIPVWASAEFDQIVGKYIRREPSREVLVDLQAELLAAGLESEATTALLRLAEAQDPGLA